MAHAAVRTLIDRWLNDQVFRSQFRADPEGTVRASGVHLDDAEWAALRAVDWNVSDSELESRINRSGTMTYEELSKLSFNYGRGC